MQRLRAAIELAVADICSEVSENTAVKISPEVATTIAELTVDKAQRSAQDLEAFAQHAKRSNVTGEDVKLLTRRNPHLVRVNGPEILVLVLVFSLKYIWLKIFFQTQQLAALQKDQPSKGRPTASKSSKVKGKPRDEAQGGGGVGGSGAGTRGPLID